MLRLSPCLPTLTTRAPCTVISSTSSFPFSRQHYFIGRHAYLRLFFSLKRKKNLPISALAECSHFFNGLHQLCLPELGTQVTAYRQNHLNNKYNAMSSLSQTKALLNIFTVCIPKYFSAWTIKKCKNHRMIHLRYACLRWDKNQFYVQKLSRQFLVFIGWLMRGEYCLSVSLYFPIHYCSDGMCL